MSKHRHHEECCYPSPMMGGMGMSGGYGYGVAGAYGGYGASCGAYGGGSYIRWIYALLILIVIVLQFGRRNEFPVIKRNDVCEGDGVVSSSGFFGREEAIDRSVLFIIVVFLLVLCGGCWFGGGHGGYGGGYGAY